MPAEEQERFSKTEFVNKLEDCFLENCLVEPGLVQDCHVLTLEHRVRLCPVTARSEVAADALAATDCRWLHDEDDNDKLQRRHTSSSSSSAPHLTRLVMRKSSFD